jgi:hypothetical protein
MLFLFWKTHTLTRENKFIPVSEINLKKAAEEEKLKGRSKLEVIFLYSVKIMVDNNSEPNRTDPKLSKSFPCHS